MFKLIFLVFITACSAAVYDYSKQNEWTGSCNDATKTEQSPIAIGDWETYTVSENLSIVSNTYPDTNSFTFSVLNENTLGLATTSTQQTQHKMTLNKLGTQVTYELINMHIHAPAEHTINGVSADISLHLVHKREAGSTDTDTRDHAVVGVLFKVDADAAENAFVSALIATPIKTGEVTTGFGPVSNLDVKQFVAAGGSFFHYPGGLTTPGCEQLVHWLVHNQMQMITQAQADALKAWVNGVYASGNARTVQAIGTRTITLSKEFSASSFVTMSLFFAIALMIIGFN